MTALFTSYETSLALRGAGAEQDARRQEPRWCHKKNGHPEVMMSNFPDNPRAFRSDEIIEALGDRLDKIERESSWWTIHYYAGENWEDKKALGDMDEPLVEVLSQAWLAVLKEGK